MIVDVVLGSERRARRRFQRDALARACYDERGVFLEGRRAELDLLRAMGGVEPSLGRLYEGHFNAALLVALFGNEEQRRRAHRDATAAELFAVWNTQDQDPVRIEPRRSGYVLSGAKTWASGADSVTRALITARRRDGGVQMCLVPLDRCSATVDDSTWRPHGMADSNSFRVAFDEIELVEDDLIGAPDDYERNPWFGGGALRFVAVHAGIVDRLMRETLTYLVQQGRSEDPYQRARAGELRVAAQSARNWLRTGEDAWNAFDAAPTERNAATVVDAVDMARVAVERAALDSIELAVRSVGAHGLVEPLPFSKLICDLQMYLRQPAPDAALARVGTAGFLHVNASRSAVIADSTGSSR
jgi:alkylation response protein AidB-like acyl-CoA dehydrogenase